MHSGHRRAISIARVAGPDHAARRSAHRELVAIACASDVLVFRRE
jgi:hypothetical protein